LVFRLLTPGGLDLSITVRRVVAVSIVALLAYLVTPPESRSAAAKSTQQVGTCLIEVIAAKELPMCLSQSKIVNPSHQTVSGGLRPAPIGAKAKNAH
jgi:hypothetical protein